MAKHEHQLIAYNGEIKFIYPVYIATGEIIAVDRIDNSRIITTFINESEYYRAQKEVYNMI